MPCSSQLIIEMFSEIHRMETFDFLKSIIYSQILYCTFAICRREAMQSTFSKTYHWDFRKVVSLLADQAALTT